MSWATTSENKLCDLGVMQKQYIDNAQRMVVELLITLKTEAIPCHALKHALK